MPKPVRSSLRRYIDYRRTFRERAQRGDLKHEYGTMDGRVKSSRRGRSFWPLFKEFLKLLRGHRATLAAALITLSVSTLLGLLPPYGMKLVFDHVLNHDFKPLAQPLSSYLPSDPKKLLMTVGLLMITIQLISICVSIWGRWQTTRITKRVQTAYRKIVFDHAVRLPLHRVYDLKSGGVASILREDAGGVGELVFAIIYNPWRAIIQLLGCLFVLAFANWKMLLGALLLLPTVWLTHRTWINRIRPLFRDIRATRQNIDSHATESFGGMRIVRAFGRRRTESGTFTTANHLMARQELFSWWWNRGIDMAWSLLIPLASALLLWFGGSRVLDDQRLVQEGRLDPAQAFTAGDLVMFITYLAYLLGPIAALAESATSLQNQLAGLDRTIDLLEEPVEFASTASNRRIDAHAVAGQVSIENVAFSYPRSKKKPSMNGKPGKNGSPGNAPPSTSSEAPETQMVLQDVSIDVMAGQTIALVGPSGAGKTTLCNLIARFYDPTAGRILLDGIDLRDIDVDSYRRILGIVEQDTFLFDGTIAQNIAYGKRDATPEQIADAARRANADDFIRKFDDGYAQLIGERGVKLSGGQRQRLTIARAILADPRILILDEATSNLDSESESLIQQSLAELMSGRTCFVIAHRLSTIRNANRIVVLENGRVVEQGTHDELMGRSGRYRFMVELQTNPPAQRSVGDATASAAQRHEGTPARGHGAHAGHGG